MTVLVDELYHQSACIFRSKILLISRKDENRMAPIRRMANTFHRNFCNCCVLSKVMMRIIVEQTHPFSEQIAPTDLYSVVPGKCFLHLRNESPIASRNRD